MTPDFYAIYNLLFHPGEVCEIRALGLNGKGPWEGFAGGAGIVYGYFDNAKDFAKAAASLDNTSARGIYVTLNPVQPDFISRAANRLKAHRAKDKTTADEIIQCMRWLPIDFDPIRPQGGSDLNSSEEEFEAAWKLRNHVAAKLRADFGAFGLPAISGNGSHLLVRLPDLPANPETSASIRKALAGVAHKWGTAAVDIDTSVHNPARIWKLYGTVARKSDHTEARPQRRSHIQYDKKDGPPTLADIPVAPADLLDRLAALAPEETAPAATAPPGATPAQGTNPPPKASVRPLRADLGPVDIGKYLAHYGYEYKYKDVNGKKVYVLDHCLFDPEHRAPDAAITVQPDGKLHYKCLHNSCADKFWPDAKAVISGTDSLAPFMDGYDPDLKRSAGKRPPEPPPIRGTRSTKGGASAAPAIDRDPADPPEYFYQTTKGTWALQHAWAADFFSRWLAPVVAVGEDCQFWQYDEAAGVWKHRPLPWLRQRIRHHMGDYASATRISQVIDLLGDQLYIPEREFQPEDGWINVQNGMLNPITDELVPHAPDFHSRVQLPVTYTLEADGDPWINTLLQIFADDEEKIDVLQEFMGYCLYPKILWPGVIWAIGGGGNGKGVLEYCMGKMLGDENICHLGLKRMSMRFGLAPLRGKLLNTSAETTSALVDLEEFKMASAGDEIQTETKNGPDIKFTPIAKHYISMNRLVDSTERTNALKRRVLILEFKQEFNPKDPGYNPRLKYELVENNLDFIFAWSVEGLKRILANGGFSQPDSVQEAMDNAMRRGNSCLMFAHECCVLGPTFQARPQQMYAAYLKWCDASGIKKPFGKNGFYEQITLNNLADRKKIQPDNADYFVGVGLKSQWDCEC